MNKNYIVAAVVAVVVLAGGAFAFSQSSNDEAADAERMAMEKRNEATAMEREAMEKDKMAKEGDAMEKTGDAMSVKGNYAAYDQTKLANAEKGDVVLFFHASWCPKCQESEKNFTSSSTPDGLTLLKIDYDDSTELKQKYGVTIQHTFVQVDKDGNELKQWNGSYNYDDLKTELN